MGLAKKTRTVKCQFCNDSVPFSEKETLTKEVKVSESTGKAKNLYYHPDCYPKHLEQQAFYQKEIDERDKLDRVVKKLYNVNLQLPHQFWTLIQDLRNGTNRFEKFWSKKYKKGVSYEVIREAYILSTHDIEWARMGKRFQSLEQELRYGLRIIQSKLNDAYRKIKTREQQGKINEAMEKVQIEDMKDNREVSFKKKEANNRDYSYLLGDD